MTLNQDLINFDVIETQKENIQSIPSGRSARTLASLLSPGAPDKLSTPTPSDTKNLNDTVRQEFENEIAAISESDDPLDVYDRYVKWTFDAYPSAQATPQSQLLPLLERATKAFLTSSHYKNDPRYLKLWLHYIRLFSDSPRETFAFLSRHNVGEGLALFYEEFAAWLETAGRWTQAEEVYKLGIQRDARPIERLTRKFGEFQRRFEQHPADQNGHSSPALPTVRPALAAKIDPFAASSPATTDLQATQPAARGSDSRSRPGRQKLAVFADDSAPSALPGSSSSDPARGWESIGSAEHRKKENVVQARPWVGETLKAGKKAPSGPKMAIFKDQSLVRDSNQSSLADTVLTKRGDVMNQRTGRTERVFVNLDAIYPNPQDPNEEWSFEELRAKHRGWTDKVWSREVPKASSVEYEPAQKLQEKEELKDVNAADDESPNFGEEPHTPVLEQEVFSDARTEGDNGAKKLKVKEVRGETQTVKTNLESPSGPKIKRKSTAEPTMTFHTRAATDEIYDIFNQPLQSAGNQEEDEDSGGDSDDDDDYTSAGESTGTGRISALSEAGEDEEEESDAKSVTEWSEFSAGKHIPESGDNEEDETRDTQADSERTETQDMVDNSSKQEAHQEDLVTPTSPSCEPIRTRYIPLPPEDYEIPTQPYRDPMQCSQNRLPFMTPIVEKTESSLAPSTIQEEQDYFNSKTPSKANGNGNAPILEVDDEEVLFSPFKEIVNDAEAERKLVLQHSQRTSTVHSELSELLEAECTPAVSSPKREIDSLGADNESHTPAASPPKAEIIRQGPIIDDLRVNPMDEDLKQHILKELRPSLSTYEGFLDHRPSTKAMGGEIRKFTKAVSKVNKNNNERTSTNLTHPPMLRFEGVDRSYNVRRELGKGAFAPVYLAELITRNEGEEVEEEEKDETMPAQNESSTRSPLEAIKMEHPPSPWEFYIMTAAKQRLTTSHQRAADSIVRAHEFHLFADEGYLIEEYRDQGTLLDLVNMAKSDPNPTTSCATSISTGGLLDETLALFFTVELFRSVEALHSHGILHGDLKADNCLVRLDAVPNPETWSPTYQPDGSDGWSSKGLALIDFGRGVDMSLFSEDVQFIADNFAAGPADCAEMREMRPWTYQVDYHGLAGVIHTLLFGKYIETVVDRQTPQHHHRQRRDSNDDDEQGGQIEAGADADQTLGPAVSAKKTYRLTEKLKRYWQCDLWSAVFDLLLNPTQNLADDDAGRTRPVVLPVVSRMKSVRERLEEYLVANAERGVGLRNLLRRVEERGRNASGGR
ncbi:MAG: hypothetical protein M4579_000920 [Chaenotheca gracillima]|nr:MAG: hypothetical protein M4579_000920 [Chaenotheca gracillima]